MQQEDLEDGDEANDSLVNDALEMHEEVKVGSLGDTDEETVVTVEVDTEESLVEEQPEEVHGLVNDNRPHPEEMQEMLVDEVGRVEETNHLEETDEKSFVDESERRQQETKSRSMLLLKRWDIAINDVVDEEDVAVRADFG